MTHTTRIGANEKKCGGFPTINTGNTQTAMKTIKVEHILRSKSETVGR